MQRIRGGRVLIAQDLVVAIERAGGTLQVLGDDCKLVIPKDFDITHLLPELRGNKQEIIALLRRRGCESMLYRSEKSQPAVSIPVRGPAPGVDEFTLWLSERCVSRAGRDDSTSISALLIDFAEWQVSRNNAPALRDVFEQLLRDRGFNLVDGMASSLLLRDDLAAHQSFAEYTAGIIERDARIASEQSNVRRYDRRQNAFV